MEKDIFIKLSIKGVQYLSIIYMVFKFQNYVIIRFKMAAIKLHLRVFSWNYHNTTHKATLCINLKYAYNGSEEINTGVSKIWLQTAEIAMLRSVET